MKENETTVEGRLRRLEEIVALLRSGQPGLDEALRLFEEGVAHARAAEEALKNAELRIEEILDDGHSRPTEPAIGRDPANGGDP